MNSQEITHNNEVTQNQVEEKDVAKLAPLNVNKPVEGQEGIQSIGHKTNDKLLKEICPSIRDYIGENISMADTKAGILIGVFSGLLSIGISKGSKMFGTAFQQWGLFEYLAIITWGILAIAIASALLVVWPRKFTAKKRGFVSWVHIANYKNVNEYLKEFLSVSEGQISSQICEHNYDLSIVCKRKYIWLSISFKAGLIGVILLAVVLIKAKIIIS